MAKLLFLSAYQLPLYDALAGAADERLAAIAGKARKESAYHLDHARTVDAAARRRHRGVAPADAGRRRRGVAVHPRAVRRRPTAAGAGRSGRRLRAGVAGHGRAGAGRGDADAGRPDGWAPAGGRGAACTPSTCPTCSPRCRCCTAPTRERRGEPASVRRGRAGGGPGDPGGRPSTSWASCGTSRWTGDGPGHRHHHPDLLRLPGDGRDPRRHPRGARRRRAPGRRGAHRARPAVEHRLDLRVRPGQARRRRHRPAGRRCRAGRRGPADR